MAFELKYYTDAGLTAESATGITREADDGSDPAQQLTIYMGSPTVALKWRAKSDPGVDAIILSIAYVNPIWVLSTVKVLDDIIREGLYNYKATSIAGGGATGATPPTWPTTVGATVVDNEVTWTNIGLTHTTAEVKLATIQGDLVTATGGVALALGVELLSEVANAQAIWIEVDDPNNSVAIATDLKLQLNVVQQEAV